MSNVLAVIGARLNSSRLPGKHLLDLAGKPLIERIFQRLQEIPQLSQIVLATTADNYNRPLIQWAENTGKQVFTYQGDVNDLLGRVDALVGIENPSMVAYFCGDSPLIEPSTVSNMIQALLDKPDADYAVLQNGNENQHSIHVGFCFYPRRIWKQLIEQAKTPEEREHLGSSIHRFIDQLQAVYVTDNPIFFQSQQRISVDTPSDYRFMQEVYRRWYAQHGQGEIVSLPWVINELERDKKLAAINTDVQQKSIDHKALRVLLVVQSGPKVGLGHMTRALVVVRSLQDVVCASVRLLIQGEFVATESLDLLHHQVISWNQDIISAIERNVDGHGADVVMFDLASITDTTVFSQLLQKLHRNKILNIAIDGLFKFEDIDYIHVPSFYLNPKYKKLVEHGKVSYGWQNYLLRSDIHKTRFLDSSELKNEWRPGHNVLVLTGGSDPCHINRLLPALLDRNLPVETVIHWVQGPFADKPNLPQALRLHWICHHDPADFANLVRRTNYALTLYGVSFFELLASAVPCVVWPLSDTLQDEMEALRKEDVACVTHNIHAAVAALVDLMDRDEQASAYARRAKDVLEPIDGARNLALHIVKMRNVHKYE